MAAKILEKIRKKASNLKGGHARIALADTTDERILKAAKEADESRLAEVILIGDRQTMEHKASQANISLDKFEIISSKEYHEINRLARAYYARRGEKLTSLDAAKEELESNELLFGATLVAAGIVDGMVAGSLSTTGDVIRAALKGIGLAPSVSVLSSMFLMAFPEIPGYREREFSLAFSDSGVLIDPTADQLADVAIMTAKTFEALTGDEPHVAMLSFSTKGSAHSNSTEKVLQATSIVQSKEPALAIDGELQFDAAFVPSVGERKAPGSPVAGKANVLIFPNLDAGNIGYKIAERLGMAHAIGPILQGLNRPMNDLSRGATVSDIVNMIAITALQSAESD